METGKRISDLRKRRGLNQEQLAEKLSVSPSTIAMWETNKRALKDDSLKQLADFFDVSTDYLLGRTDDKEKAPTLVAAHLDDDVSEEDMEDILKYIEFRKNNPLGKKK
ncbi:helix-turn-helix transcriptional regulator [Enterococcus asini]|uniref:helix-turn-helix domain-containing protein n=1 Tax=Enterococcus asini TaxID=57732 RepID=UPI0028916373|nr:helix-turn-helix transcriptional regulator [Enterococcus asini]MDT2756943.1 helix-turn-helix transcriptional regulator [Enterococcus asini]